MAERVLIVGGGGREMALVLALKNSPQVEHIVVAPGSDAIAQHAKVVDIPVDDVDALLKLAQKEELNFCIVGPEQPLALGIADIFQCEEMDIFAPSKKAARIETSKEFAKNLMQEAQVPTANFQVYRDYQAAIEGLEEADYPLVIKENGLKAGKGVHICQSLKEAQEVVAKLEISEQSPVIFEEFLEGFEFSLIVMAQGEKFVVLPTSQDYKAIYDGQEGPNTGGMGAVSPVPKVTSELQKESIEKVIRPILRTLAEKNCPFTGFLYAGLMATKDGVKVIEFNARLGDPESEVILPLVADDLMTRIRWIYDEKIPGGFVEPTRVRDMGSAIKAISLFKAKNDAKNTSDQEAHELGNSADTSGLPPMNLNKHELRIHEQVCLGVVLTSPGYPGKVTAYPLIPQAFFDKAKAAGLEIVHMGTEKVEDGYQAKGGRVLIIRTFATNIFEAREKIYGFLKEEKALIPDFHYRTDIGLAAE